MYYKVSAATVDPSGKIVGLATARVDLLATRVELVDIRVGFTIAKAFLDAAKFFDKDLVSHKVLFVHKVVDVHKVVVVGNFLVEFAEFWVGSHKF